MVGLLVLMAWSLLLLDAEEHPGMVAFHKSYALNHGDANGRGSLHVEPRRLRRDDRMTLDVRFTNDGRGRRFFNPFFNSLLPFPAAVAVYDAEKNYVGNYLDQQEGSRRLPDDTDWAFIVDDGYAGAMINRRAGAVVDPERAGPLPPGKYYLQAVFYKGFVTFDKIGKPEMTFDEIRNFYDSFDYGELFRSNVVEIELLTEERQSRP